jgi:hypothetical protein
VEAHVVVVAQEEPAEAVVEVAVGEVAGEVAEGGAATEGVAEGEEEAATVVVMAVQD